MRDAHLPEAMSLNGQLNYWQSIKWQGRYDEVRSEVEKADFSAKHPRYELAYRALREDKDGFFTMLPTIIRQETLTFEDLDKWPIFQEMRKDPRFNATLGRSGPPPTAPTIADEQKAEEPAPVATDSVQQGAPSEATDQTRPGAEEEGK
jgi:hypothetical protein